MRARSLKQSIAIGLLLVFIFWLSYLIVGLVRKTNTVVNEASIVRRQYETLEGRRQSLEKDLAALATVRGKDAAMRASFGVARPGEELIIVVPPVEATTTTETNWWRRIFGWFR